MPEEDTVVRSADGLRSQRELTLLERQNLASNNTRHGQPVGEPDGDEHIYQGTDAFILEQHRQQDNDDQRRYPVQNIDDTHHDVVDSPSKVGGDPAIGDADEKVESRANNAYGKLDALTVHDTCHLIASQLIRSEGMSQRGGLKRIVQVLIFVAVW